MFTEIFSTFSSPRLLLLPGKLISSANFANFGIDHEKCWNMRHSGHIYGIFELSECFKALGDHDS